MTVETYFLIGAVIGVVGILTSVFLHVKQVTEEWTFPMSLEDAVPLFEVVLLISLIVPLIWPALGLEVLRRVLNYYIKRKNNA